MTALRTWLLRVLGSFDPRHRDRDLADELNGHLQRHIDDNVRAGMAPDEARRDALLRIGGLAQTQEQIRDRSRLPFIDVFVNDLRFAIRLLHRSPGYALAAIAALAVGVGANTAVFSVVNGVLMKALPYKDPQQLVLLFEQLPVPGRFGFSPPDFLTFHGVARSFEGTAAYQTARYELAGIGEPQRLAGARVSPGIFPVLGVEAVLGRTLTEDEDRQGARVAVVSNGMWSRVFGRDPAILGRAISLDGRAYTVVGVLPGGFVFPPRGAVLNGEPADVFVPMSFTPFERQAFGMMYNSTVIARLAAGVSVEQARADAARLVPALLDSYPPPLRPFLSRLTIRMTPLTEETVGESRRLLAVLMGAVVLVLLIGCADVASLLLTRSAARQRELAVRSALGASTFRVAGQLLTEALVLGIAGSTVGLVLGYGLMRLLLVMAGERLPRAESIAFDTTVFAFTAVLAILTPLLFGIIPTLRAARGVDADALKEGARQVTFGRRRAWLLNSLVIGQFAVALVLSVGGGLLVRSFVRLMRTDPGFRFERAVRASVFLPVGRYAEGQPLKDFYRRAIEATAAIPGVTTTGAGNDLPLSVRERRAFMGDSSARPISQPSRLVAVTWTTGGYFEALGIALKRGRYLTDADAPAAQRATVVNERLAKMLWPDGDPIGRQIRWGIDIPENQSPWMTIVGVVADAKQAGLDAATIAQVYVPLAQDNSGFLRSVNLVARSPRDEAALMADMRHAIHQLDPSLPITTQSLGEMIGESVKPQQFSMSVMTAFAALALLLAALGIYGVLANAIAQQTQEIGVRVALGATRGDVMWMVFRRGLVLAGSGLLIGTAAALAVTRAMAGLLYEVRATDAPTFLSAATLLAATALAASLVPAWHAARVDPIVALRAE